MRYDLSDCVPVSFIGNSDRLLLHGGDAHALYLTVRTWDEVWPMAVAL